MRQPRELLGDVDLGREQRELLLQPVLVRIEPRLPQARAELLDVRRMDRRDARRDAADLRLDVGAAGLEQARELRAFAGARRGELGERLRRRSACDARAELVRRHGRLGEHAGPAQDLVDRQRRCAPGRAARTSAAASASSADAAGIDGERSRRRLATVRATTRHSTLPRLSSRGDALAQRRLEPAQLVGKLERAGRDSGG